MMKLPDELDMKAMLFGDGHDGRYMQQYRNEEYGVGAVRTGSNKEPQKTTYTADKLPEKEFNSWSELQGAYNAA